MREIMNISLPPKLKKEVEAAVKKGNYSSKSEFVRELLRSKVSVLTPTLAKPISVAEVKRKAVPILKRAGVCRASVFGSVARGEATTDSDIDILIEFERGKVMGLIGFVGLEQELEKVLHKKVDLGTYSSVNKLLKEQIMKEQIRIL